MMESILSIEKERIDQKATRKQVEGVLEALRKYKSMGAVRREVMERPAAHKAESDDLLTRLDSECEHALSMLEENEQEIIRKRYLHKDKQFDFLLFHELNMSERTYRRVKARAIAKLAYMLRLEVVSQ